MKPYRLVWTHEVLRIQATDEDFGSWDEMLARQNELQDAGATTYCLRWDGLQYEEVFSKSVFSSATDKEEPGHGGRFNAQECRVLIGTLNKASRLEKYGFTYMEQVYFQVGESYLGNFYRGHVLAPGINETLLIIGAKQVDARAPTLAHLPADSVISAKKFKKLRSRLISQGRINDPQARRKRLPIMTHVDYEPPTIDAAQDVLGELNKVPTRRSNLKVVKGGDVKLILRRKASPSSLGEV